MSQRSQQIRLFARLLAFHEFQIMKLALLQFTIIAGAVLSLLSCRPNGGESRRHESPLNTSTQVHKINRGEVFLEVESPSETKLGDPAPLAVKLINKSQSKIRVSVIDGLRELKLQMIGGNGEELPFTEYGEQKAKVINETTMRSNPWIEPGNFYEWKFDANQLFKISAGQNKVVINVLINAIDEPTNLPIEVSFNVR